MGTRSNTVVVETGHDKEFRLINIYRQFDGYPSGHGKALSAFILSTKLCNGIPLGHPADAQHRLANGAGCFAAQLVKHLKDGAGGIYIDAPDGPLDNDYAYIIRIDSFKPVKGVEVEVRCGGSEIFRGHPHAFAEFCSKAN